MRTISICLSIAVLSVLGPSLGVNAQDTNDEITSPPFFIDRDARFAILFPGDPIVNDISYMTEAGTLFPAQRFSLKEGTNEHIVTVVDFSDGPAVDIAIVENAVEETMRGGELIYEAEAEYEPGVGSRQFMASLDDGREIQASVYMWDHRLFITEAIGAPGVPSLLRFAQSFTMLEADGGELNFDPGPNEPAR